ncbi:DNA polymerase III subunit gamma/tau [Aestuariibacter salexigens]|uniref:DNA polymerase III subunit gamma/tau n=1 Tax=Aestuariibacter salexigens TaxID=226010 RepID=UPI000416F801|nr:DNA polymerase III subunit gamma/tau [Aestuariibacter salexigens]
MSYQVLARKWRPNTFAELVGQEHVVAAISNALDNNRLHHAYLFTGTRGVGKTTIARIFAKSLNCETGMSATPCGQCGTCQEIEQGNYVDLLEIDAASRTKVEDTRELLDNVQYKPTRGQYKVYLIDEVHMLSKHSFNALLKTLEEPPPHVKFLLATTDPQKLPITILSRCLQFNLKALSREQISSQLEHVLGHENIVFEQNALAQLARAAQGSMRDALSLTDQAIAQGNNVVSLQVVTDMLGLMDKGQVIKLLHAVVSGEQTKVFEIVEQLAALAPDFQHVLAEMQSLLHQIALTQFVPDACKLETIHAKAIYTLSKSVAPELVQLLYQIALQGRKDLPHAADPRSGFDMTLLRMLAFKPDGVSLPPQELTAASPRSTSVSSQGDDVYTSSPPADEQQSEPATDDHSHYDVQALEDEQQHIIDESQQWRNEPPMSEPDYAAAQPQPESQPETVSETSTEQNRLSALEQMLALKQKLKSGTDNVEDASPSKKPDADAQPDDVADTQPVKPLAAEPALNAQTQPNVESNELAPAQVSGDEDLPPWLTEPLPESDRYIPPERNEQSFEQPVQVDSHAHLNDSVTTIVDKEVPAFLQSGDKVVNARQLDKWADMIEHMSVEALTKQLALHSSMSMNGNTVELLLSQDKGHLDTEPARAQLAHALSKALDRNITLDVRLGEPANTPYALQREIERVRQEYAVSVVNEDATIGKLRDMFAAEVIQDSIKPR